MSINSKIEWTHHTANLWHGCTKVHAGCDHCYAETLSRRWKRDIWGNDKPRMEIISVWKDLANMQKQAAAAGEVHRVFVGSMMDIFEKPMPLIDSKGMTYESNTGNLRDELFSNISLGKYPNLLFLFLTKRPSNINKYIPESWKVNPPANVMFGTSPADQATADSLIPQLLQVNGKRFLSIEPLLGPIEFSNVTKRSDAVMQLGKKALAGIDWVIVGGESGHGARPMHPDWVRSIRDQCDAAGVPFHFKQWGEYTSTLQKSLKHLFRNPDKWITESGRVGEESEAIVDDSGETWLGVHRVGKKAAGRELDGKTHDGLPNYSIQNTI